MKTVMEQWALTIVLGLIGAFFIAMSYGAMIESKKSGRHISGVPVVGGVILAVAFLLSPVKWLAFLGLLDYGLWMIPFSLISRIFQKNKKP